jgi:hypothetical protein
MEANTAVEITESLGANLIYDKSLNLFTVFFADAWAYLQPKDLEEADEEGYKRFLMSLIVHEMESIQRYGGPTRH